ncbi:hypothetical protein HZB88_03545 [archaeon]|nr:hypothetical protein [archaeon]
MAEGKDSKEETKNPLILNKPLTPKFAKGKHRLTMESMTSSIEKYYFWTLRFIKNQPNYGLGYPTVIKINDIFDASVASTFHGQIGSKISAIQQQVSNYLAQIGQMLKTLLPIVREIRIMDERLDYYKRSLEGEESAEIALKSIWIEVVEGGINNPNSVYSMATKLGFITLPDLFFKIAVQGDSTKKQLDNVDNAIKGIELNKKVKDALAKKLFQYHEWKDKTYREMGYTRKFRIRNLKQHWNVIKLYTEWLRPYLKTLKALQFRGNFDDPELISAFESSKVEIELLALREKEEDLKSGKKKYTPCIKVRFVYSTRPVLEYVKEGQKGPAHFGRTEITIEPFAVEWKDIEEYKKQKEKEDWEMVSDIFGAMESIGEDVQKYLKEAEEGEKEEKKEEEKPSLIEVLSGGFIRAPKKKEKSKKEKPISRKQAKSSEEEKEKAKKEAIDKAYVLYDIFKAGHKMWRP